MTGAAADPGPQDQNSLTYRWDFGDGSSADGPNVSHSYNQPGNYTVKLTVTDKDGAQGTDTTTVQVKAVNTPPTAVINGPKSGPAGSLMTFSASESSDPDGRIVSYTWNFGDGATASGIEVNHVYKLPGVYKVVLTVTDEAGSSRKAVQKVTIEAPIINRPPAAIISGPTTGLTGESLTFSGAASADQDGRIISYAWDFGDGATSNRVEVTHTYSDPGTYKVSLTVTDDGCLTATATQMVQIETPTTNRPPVAVIRAPSRGPAQKPLRFSASGSSDPDGRIVSYVWDFGDGTTAEGVKVIHSYKEPNHYKVVLIVTDEGGLSDRAAHEIEIDDLLRDDLPPPRIIKIPTPEPPIKLPDPPRNLREKG
jgi:PKD repeat protein